MPAPAGKLLAECGMRGREYKREHRTSKGETAGKRSFVTGRSEVVLCLSWAIVGERLHFGFRRGPRAITLVILRKLNRRKPLTFILIYL
jgi:hypothetical protein